MKTSGIKALIFDFDGIIMDTEGAAFRSWASIYKEYSLQLPVVEFCSNMGTKDTFSPGGHLLANTRCPHSLGDLDKIYKQRFKALTQHMQARAGIASYIESAKSAGLKLAIGSSSSHSYVTGFMGRLGLYKVFDLFCCGDEVEQVKPHPGIFLNALKGLGLPGGAALVFEDSVNGIRAARAAGIPCVAVPNSINGFVDFSEADLRLESFTEKPLSDVLSFFK